MVIPMHIHQQSLGRDKSLNCSSQDFPSKLKKQGLCRALEPASKFILDYPFSEIVVRLIHLKKNNVRVPGSFPKTRIKKSLQTVALIFQDKSWLLKLISHEHNGKLSARWAAFRTETPMQVEDICVLELY
ncbi:uncharacterized protein LOC120290322 [Eucalyptus grandis]|uniref:uncharacterized protein LOC120290322 n=1 Tax=Eucalyptus grandis TaxID=71139 RepID=UPI00192EF945|nr:uncharacterized protein LOC120290322 [Eucalyptus grandis]XP_039162203.1 uncharacterized protein LOC120290322 [Eucalyptus grandis]XP_039162208.1 uncharacterized protein LOC120290322 [Eucalyptus grandis]